MPKKDTLYLLLKNYGALIAKNFAMLLYGERHNENALSRAPLSRNVPTQVKFIHNTDDMNSAPIDIDQMLLDAVVRPLN